MGLRRIRCDAPQKKTRTAFGRATRSTNISSIHRERENRLFPLNHIHSRHRLGDRNVHVEVAIGAEPPCECYVVVARRRADRTIAVILEMPREAQWRGKIIYYFISLCVMSIDELAALATKVRSQTKAKKHVSGAEIGAKSRLPAKAVSSVKAIVA
jgi:hypothetical protein